VNNAVDLNSSYGEQQVGSASMRMSRKIGGEKSQANANQIPDICEVSCALFEVSCALFDAAEFR
jgi:hypothetical protein